MEKEFIEAVTVGTFNDAEQAKPVRRRLEEDGIHCQYTLADQSESGAIAGYARPAQTVTIRYAEVG